jgi:hypothetical protein
LAFVVAAALADAITATEAAAIASEPRLSLEHPFVIPPIFGVDAAALLSWPTRDNTRWTVQEAGQQRE